jgi:hypothetical protein
VKIIVSVIVYNRLENLKRWLRCWKDCDQTNAELVIVHNDDGQSERFKTICDEAKVKYVHRVNIGMDIAAFQDVCRERLSGFPNEWDYLLWITDDTLPMQKDFIRPFIEKLQDPSNGLSCMQISKSTPGNIWHVRTTGFCISKEISKKLTFPADPIRTRQECYSFEHRGGKKTLSEQIRAMGLACVQVAKNAESPLFDTGYWKRLNREDEHEAVFPSGKKKGDTVTFICTIYNTYPQIISSLILQTHQNWRLILIHDGPNETGLKSQIPSDKRITYIETKERKGNYGHHLRQWALNEFELGSHVVVTNADNYYTPVFIEYMLQGFKKSHTAVATYCTETVHSYKGWQILPAKLERGYLDCGAVVIKSNIAKEVGWRDIKDHSADWTFFSDIASKYSWRNFIPVRGALFVHN